MSNTYTPSILFRNICFCYTNSQFTVFGGFTFDPYPNYISNQQPAYYHAQLAFRGFSISGTDVSELKQRLQDAAMTRMDPLVEEQLTALRQRVDNEGPLVEHQLQQWQPRSLPSHVWGLQNAEVGRFQVDYQRQQHEQTRRIQAEDLERQRLEEEERLRAQELEGWYAQGFEKRRAEKIEELKDTESQRLRVHLATLSSPLQPSQQHFQEQFRHLQQIQPRLPPTDHIVDRNLAGLYPLPLLLKYFFNEKGEDTGAEPLELAGLSTKQRCKVLAHATNLCLQYGTTKGNVIVIGSGRDVRALEIFEERLDGLDPSSDSMHEFPKPLYSAYSSRGFIRLGGVGSALYERAGWEVVHFPEGALELALDVDREEVRGGLSALQSVLSDIHRIHVSQQRPGDSGFGSLSLRGLDTTASREEDMIMGELVDLEDRRSSKRRCVSGLDASE